MKKYVFAKYQGVGNDFIIVNALHSPLPEINGQTALAWCDRHFGIGADGLIVLLPSSWARCRMLLFNSDGSEAPMCGNGLRCMVMFARDEGLIEASEYAVETPAGVLQARLQIGPSGQPSGVTVQMGQPRLLARDVPTTLAPGDQRVVQAPLAVNSQEWAVTAMNMGNPQCVVFVPNVDEIDLHRLGPAIERHPAFPQRANVMFVQVLRRQRLQVSPWERGAGATLACGTGACAAAVAGVLTGRSERQVQVILPGGVLQIEWESSGQVIMSGPATRVFAGEI